MADNIPTPPGGALPPKPAEASKVQPKKETVRINLPPKPTSAPTIKLPTLAPGSSAPIGAAAAPVAATAAAPAASKAPPPPTPPASGAAPRAGVITTVLGPVPAKPAAPAVAPRPMAPMVSGLTTLDKGLAIAAAVATLAALGCVLYLAYFLKDPAAM
jgi:translation initiation factor IF-2